MSLMASSSAGGFSAALVVPALVSTLKQAQREAEAELHVLAAYYADRDRCGGKRELTTRELDALIRIGELLTEQGISGAAFFLAAQAGILFGGVGGGMAAQVLITANGMTNPKQAQAFSPGREILSRVGGARWVERLSSTDQKTMATHLGHFALRAGYGTRVEQRPTRLALPACEGRTDWDAVFDASAPRGAINTRRRGLRA